MPAGRSSLALCSLDETGSNTAMARRYGRAPHGRRIDGPVPHGHCKTVTLTAAIRLGGAGGRLAFDGATDAATFGSYVAMVLVPTLRRGDIVVMDNLGAHKGGEVERLIRSAGAEVRYLPASSPDFNPIEKMFSKLKTYLRRAAARSVGRLIEAMGDALRSVAHDDIAGCSVPVVTLHSSGNRSKRRRRPRCWTRSESSGLGHDRCRCRADSGAARGNSRPGLTAASSPTARARPPGAASVTASGSRAIAGACSTEIDSGSVRTAIVRSIIPPPGVSGIIPSYPR